MKPLRAWRLSACCAAIVLTCGVAHAQRVGPIADEAPARATSAIQGGVRSAVNGAGSAFSGAGSITDINPLAVLDGAAGALPGVGGDAPAMFGKQGREPGANEGTTSGTSSRQGGLSTAVNILVVLTVISLVPSIMLMTTCFVRILVVLGLLRQAIGAQSVPPPQVITALSLFMTLVVMTPTIDRINKEAIQPWRAGEVRDYDEMWSRARQPMRDFMFAQIEATGNWSSLYMVLEHRGVDTSKPEALKRADVDMVSLIPAYMLSELKTAFLMGFKIYLPFLVIDMVVSTMLISMGMMMVPPVLVSLPFKLLLFVLVDGWTLVVGGLMGSFAQPGVAMLGVPLHVPLGAAHDALADLGGVSSVLAHSAAMRDVCVQGVRGVLAARCGVA